MLTPSARSRTPIEKELSALRRREDRLARAARNARPPRWKTELEQRVPEKARRGLEAAFARAFTLVFDQGTPIIARTYDRKELESTHSALDRAVLDHGDRRALRQMKKAPHLAELALTTAEGVGLGLLGIGLPDLVLFVGMLLRGVYETALRYGVCYDAPSERFLILCMMEAAITVGPAFEEKELRVNRLLDGSYLPTEAELAAQTRQTADAFADELLVLKFLQGLPLVGALGGAANPLCYHKILRYAALKYRKRYLFAAAARRAP